MTKLLKQLAPIYLFSCILLLNSCGAAKIAKLLPPHQQTLSTAANGKMSNEAKLDALGETLVKVMEESMSFTRIRCSIKHVDDFGSQNDQSISRIIKELGPWFQSQSTAEKLLLGARLAGKPYSKELIRLVPKFEKKVKRKIKTFKFFGKVLKFVNPKNMLGL